MLFAQLPGLKNKDVIFEHLMKLKTKKMSKAEFNEKLNEDIQGKKKSSFFNVNRYLSYNDKLH